MQFLVDILPLGSRSRKAKNLPDPDPKHVALETQKPKKQLKSKTKAFRVFKPWSMVIGYHDKIFYVPKSQNGELCVF